MQHINILEIILIILSISFFLLYIRSIINTKKVCQKIVEDVKKEVEDRLYNDELTNLKNRKALEDYIKDKDSVVTVLLDLDSFEDLNELYGFINAELVLVEVANILKEFENSYDVIAYRLSGDIFALVNAKNMPFNDIFLLIEKLNQTFLNKKIYIDELKSDIIVSMTMGISIFQESL